MDIDIHPSETAQPATTSVIKSPHNHDVICGRGGRVNSHPGNRRFRSWINERKEAYTLAQSKGIKFSIAQDVLSLLRAQNPPGRVLQYDSKTNTYHEVCARKAMSKTTQALREGAPKLRESKGIIQDQQGKNKSSGGNSSTTGGRPNSVHIKLTSNKAVGALRHEAWRHHDNNNDAYDSSSSLSHNSNIDEHSKAESERFELQNHHVANNVSYDSGECSTSRKRLPDTYTDTDECDNAQKGNKKPKIVVASSEDESSMEGVTGTRTPPTDGSADLLYALATTCAKQAPSLESPPKAKQNVSPPDHLDRLVTPEQGSPQKLSEYWTKQVQGFDEQLALLESLRAGTGIPASYNGPSLSSATLTPKESVRLEKERTVQEWLITSMPYLHTDDIRAYTRRLVDDGFDSLPMLNDELEESDLDFMKKGHRRALLKVVQGGNGK